MDFKISSTRNKTLRHTILHPTKQDSLTFTIQNFAQSSKEEQRGIPATYGRQSGV